MDISIVENNIEKLNDPNLISIAELIVDAVKSYPKYGLTDTNEYFEEVRKILNAEQITLKRLKSYLKINEGVAKENDIWIIESLSALTDAFELMEMYRVSFNELLSGINKLN